MTAAVVAMAALFVGGLAGMCFGMWLRGGQDQLVELRAWSRGYHEAVADLQGADTDA